MIQSGPNPISAEVAKEQGNVSLFQQQASSRQTDEASQNLERRRDLLNT
jgi:hypothetical protein